jgi:reverse transcriptase-like protein
MDDILVYSNNEEEHTDHVLKVLHRLRERKLQLDIDKCDFDAKEVKYLGLIIASEGIRMDPEKLKTIRDWQTPASVVDVQQFVEFCGFYRRFIQNFSRYTRPLNELTKGESYLSRTGKRKMRYKPFVWTEACQQAFDGLKDAFETAPILIHFDPERETWIETDASDFVTAGIISQMVDGTQACCFLFQKDEPCGMQLHDL